MFQEYPFSFPCAFCIEASNLLHLPLFSQYYLLEFPEFPLKVYVILLVADLKGEEKNLIKCVK